MGDRDAGRAADSRWFRRTALSVLAATQIPKPADEQAFERASIVLWRGILADPNVQRNGRRGQRQNGVDLFGTRNGDPGHLVGIQCKLKGPTGRLTEKEVRHEFGEALTFRPPLREFFITTTAPDDAELQELARELAVDAKASGRTIQFYVWGWNTLEERIDEHDDARNAFDPNHSAFAAKVLANLDAGLVLQEGMRAELGAGLSQLSERVTLLQVAVGSRPGDHTGAGSALEMHLDAEIDGYRELANSGRPRTALPLLQGLLERVGTDASGRILFRIKANIGSCLFMQGEDTAAADMLSEAYGHAPKEPKAVANKAFSLLLQDRWREVLALGERTFRTDPSNDDLAGYVVQAASFADEPLDPLALVPDQVRGSRAVAIAHVHFLRRLGRTPDWWHAARAAVGEHGEDKDARRFAAEADLDEVLGDGEFQRTRIFRGGGRERVRAAAGVLSSMWADLVAAEPRTLRPEEAVLCVNLIAARHALNEFGEAAEAARQGMSIAPDDVEIPRRAAAIALACDDDDLASQVLARLPPGPDATVLAFQRHMRRGDWGAMAELYRARADDVPDVERAVFITAGQLAEVKSAPRADAERRVREIAAEAAGDPRAGIVVAGFAERESFAATAELAYRSAIAAIGPSSHVAARWMVARHAVSKGDWRMACEILDGHVDEQHESDELRLLATALVNDLPVRRRAIRFFDRLAPALKGTHFFLQAEGLMHFNRGERGRAEDCLRRAIDVGPDATDLIALFTLLHRDLRGADIAAVLGRLDVTVVPGTPAQRMVLAQALRAAGRVDEAIPFGYRILSGARNDPDVVLKYFGLLMFEGGGRGIPASSRVELDRWVRLEGPAGTTHAFIVEDGEDRPADGVINPANPMATAAMGRAVGERFRVSTAFGREAEWTVVEVKHKYLHALHDGMENFQVRFPGADGLYKLEVTNGGVAEVVGEARRASEALRRLADMHLLHNFPMAMVAALSGSEAVQFAEYLRSIDQDVRTCVGDLRERLAAREAIAARRGAGAVLDAYTAWTAATMDILDVLKAVFGELRLPRSEMDALRMLHNGPFASMDRAMSLRWDDGRLVGRQGGREQEEGRRSLVSEQVRKIEEACRVEPVAAPDAPSAQVALIDASFGPNALDVVHLAAEGGLLLSDDLCLRQVAATVAGVTGVWLQTTLLFGLEIGSLDTARYAEACLMLSGRRHAHLALNATTVELALASDPTDRLDWFAAMLRFVANPTADMRSHLNVVAETLHRLWSTPCGIPRAKVMRATGMLLDRLVGHKGTDWALALALVQSGQPATLRLYVRDWASGHFLPPAKLAAAEWRLVGVNGRSGNRTGRTALLSTTASLYDITQSW